MNHGLQTYWARNCRCLICRAAYSDYRRESYARRKAGRKGCVLSGGAKSRLEDFGNQRGAARWFGIGQATVSRIKAGKKIRAATERRILAA